MSIHAGQPHEIEGTEVQNRRVKQFDVVRVIRLSRREIPIIEWSEKRKRYEITVVTES